MYHPKSAVENKRKMNRMGFILIHRNTISIRSYYIAMYFKWRRSQIDTAGDGMVIARAVKDCCRAWASNDEFSASLIQIIPP